MFNFTDTDCFLFFHIIYAVTRQSAGLPAPLNDYHTIFDNNLPVYSRKTYLTLFAACQRKLKNNKETAELGSLLFQQSLLMLLSYDSILHPLSVPDARLLLRSPKESPII